MPLSNRLFDEQVKQFLSEHPAQRYLDIGAGAGKYGKLIKSFYPNSHITAVEADGSYIAKYEIEKIYDKVQNIRIEQFIRSNPSFSTDIVILGDLLEHLFKSDGV